MRREVRRWWAVVAGVGGGGEKRVLTLEWHCGIAPPTFSANDFSSETRVPRKFVSSSGNKFPSRRATFDVCSARLRAFQFSSRPLISPIATISFTSETKKRGMPVKSEESGRGGGARRKCGEEERERERQTDRIERKRERRKETVLESKRSFPWFRAFGASLHSHVISFYHYQCSTKLLRGALAPGRRSEISGVGKRLAD